MKCIILILFFLMLQPLAAPVASAESTSGDPAAAAEDAVILSIKGVIDNTFTAQMSKNSVEVKMQFLTQKGIDDNGKLILEYKPPAENIGDIRGLVTLPDGQTLEITKNDIYTKKITKEFGESVTEVRVVFPGLKPGATVEYAFHRSYTGLKDLFTWPFQHEIRTVHSEVSFVPWPGRRWGFSVRNAIADPQKKETHPGGNLMINFSRENIPALPKEPFSQAYDSERELICFYYSETAFGTDDFWKEWGAEFYRSELKGKLKSCLKADQIIKENFAKHPKDETLIAAIYNYTAQNYLSLEALSKQEEENIDQRYLERLYGTDNTQELFNFKYISKLRINFILASLIKTALPDAETDLVLYSPWNKGLFDPSIRCLDQLSERMLKVTYQGKVFWLDPSKRYMKYNMVNWNAKGIQLLVASKKGIAFEKIPLDKWNDIQSKSSMKISFDREAGLIVGEQTLECNPYESYVMRKSLLYYTGSERKDYLEEKLRENFGEKAKLISFEADGLEDLSRPLILTQKFESPYEFEEAGDQILFRLPGLSAPKTNPFLSDTRKGRIFFPYPYRKTQEIVYTLPADLKCENLPQNVKIGEQLLIHNLAYEKTDDHTFKVKCEETLEGNMMVVDAAKLLKRTYNDMLELYRKPLTLVKS